MTSSQILQMKFTATDKKGAAVVDLFHFLMSGDFVRY